jgi:hypothetical protein
MGALDITERSSSAVSRRVRMAFTTIPFEFAGPARRTGLDKEIHDFLDHRILVVGGILHPV